MELMACICDADQMNAYFASSRFQVSNINSNSKDQNSKDLFDIDDFDDSDNSDDDLFEEMMELSKMNINNNRSIEKSKIYSKLASDLYSKGIYEDAFYCYKQAISHNINNSELLFACAVANHEHGDIGLAKSLYKRTLQLNPMHDKAHYNLAYLYQDFGKLESSLKHLQIAVQINPTDTDTLISLSLVNKKLGYLDEAVKCCQDALNIDKQNIIANYNLAVLYQGMGELLQSIRLYHKVLYNDGEHIDALLNLSIAYQDFALQADPIFRIDYLNKALECYEILESINFSNSEIHFIKLKIIETIKIYEKTMESSDKKIRFNK